MQQITPENAGGNAQFITVLTSADGTPQVKRFTPDGVQDIPNTKWFTHRTAQFQNLHQLAAIIGSLQPTELVIPGMRNDVPAPNAEGNVTATVNDDPAKNRVAYFTDRPAPTLTFDMDKLPVPQGCGWHDVPGMAATIWHDLQQRYAILQGVGCVWKTSGSAGMPGREHLAKFHFTVLTAGLLDHDRKAALRQVPEADIVMRERGRKHFFGGRICDGVPDPLDGQHTMGVIDGGPLNYLPTPEPVKMPAPQPIFSDQTNEDGRRALDGACRKLSATVETDRHVASRDTARLVGGWVGSGAIAYADATAALYHAVSGFKDPEHHQANIDEYLRIGTERPIALGLGVFAEAQRHMPTGTTMMPPGAMPRPQMPTGPRMPAPVGHPAAAALSNAADIIEEIARTLTDTNLDEVADRASKLNAADRERLVNKVAEVNTTSIAKALKSAIAAIHTRFALQRGQETVAQLNAGPLAPFFRVKRDDDGKPKAVNRHTGQAQLYNDFLIANKELPDVIVEGPNDKPKAIPAAEYWWSDDSTERFDVYGFDPERPETWHNDFGQSVRNAYVPAHKTPGPTGMDVRPYLYILQANFPDEGDQNILLGALAFAMQNPGKLLRWAPVLQGTQGCGKGLLVRGPLLHACGRNAGVASPKALAGDYNGYMYRKTVVIVDEIGDRPKAALADIAEDLKEPITEPTIPFRIMRTDPFDGPNFACWFFMTNHIGSMLASPGERRYAHFISRLQTEQDVAAFFTQGWWETFFPEVVVATGGAGLDWFTYYAQWWQMMGAENVRGFLEAYPAARPGRAPTTTSTAAAMAEGEHEISRLVRECVTEGDYGFRGGFVNSVALKVVMQDAGIRDPGPKWLGKAVQDAGFRYKKRFNAPPCDTIHLGAHCTASTKVSVYCRDDPGTLSPAAVCSIYEAAQTSNEATPQAPTGNVVAMRPPGE